MTMTICDRVRTLILWIIVSSSLTNNVYLVTAQECDASGRCDRHERCAVWKEEGECLLNKAYMAQQCPVSCKNARIIPTDECEDLHPRCKLWASTGECEENESNMSYYCPRSCGKCDEDYEEENIENTEPEASNSGCEDKHENCAMWAKLGECDKNKAYMHAFCPKSCKTCDRVSTVQMPRELDDTTSELLKKTESFGIRQKSEGTASSDTVARIKESVAYMESEETNQLPEGIRTNCQNRHELCAFWATLGECQNNKAYMQTNCAPSCMSCQMIDLRTRCPPLNQVPALHPGSLNKMFERIVRSAPGNKTLTDDERRELLQSNMTEYTVHILSRPSESPATEVSPVVDKSLPPWAVVFDNFLTHEECDELIRLGYEFGYKRSEDVGPLKFDGTHTSIQNTGRTSENAWCSEVCRAHDVPVRILNRIEKVLGIPANNSEDLQMLKYEKGQFYRTHHDFIPHQVDRQCGPRILTFFTYLSDVEAGGGTNFPQLDITVMPKKGRALLWPSVLDSDPLKKDDRFMHQALPVEEGVKFAANGWIHMYDYLSAQKNNCN